MEVLIIGASLAGLSVARALHNAGMTDFAVLDAKPELGLPLKCGEAVDSETLEALYGPGVFDEPFALHRTREHRVRYRGIERRFEFDYTELDRPAFERWLAKPFGAQLMLDTRATRVQRHAGGFLVTTSHHTTLQCRCLVLCTGASFNLHASLGLTVKKPPLGFATGGVFSAASDNGLGQGFLWQVEDALCGYVWSFRKGKGQWNIGAAGTEPKRLKQSMEQFLAPSAALREKTLGGHYPVGGPLAKTYGDGFLVCGDAAGMVFAGTGEGIRYALRSGQLAGETLLRAKRQGAYGARQLHEYQRRWQKVFGAQLRGGVRFLHLLKLLIRLDRLEAVVRRIPAEVLGELLLTGRVPWRYLPRLLWLQARLYLAALKHSSKSAATNI